MMTQKKIPQRRCVGCGASFDKNLLIRVVKTPEGTVELDSTGKKNGRGAYLCRNVSCFRAAQKKKRFSANLGTEIPGEVFDAIVTEVERIEKENAPESVLSADGDR